MVIILPEAVGWSIF